MFGRWLVIQQIKLKFGRSLCLSLPESQDETVVFSRLIRWISYPGFVQPAPVEQGSRVHSMIYCLFRLFSKPFDLVLHVHLVSTNKNNQYWKFPAALVYQLLKEQDALQWFVIDGTLTCVSERSPRWKMSNPQM